MKRAKRQPPATKLVIKPRNPLATAPLLKKGGAHARQDKRAARARQKAQLRKTLSDAA
jgi:hypothetical protein